MSIPSTTSVVVATGSGDPTMIPDQYAIDLGPSVSITADIYDTVSGISTYTCSSAHGLVSGNQFRLINSSNVNLGDFYVKERVGVNTFTATTNANFNIAGGYVLRGGLVAADATSDESGENLGARGLSFYDKETLTLGANITSETSIVVSSPVAGIGTAIRFPLGSYIQIDSEMMRVTSSSLSGAGSVSYTHLTLPTNREV